MNLTQKEQERLIKNLLSDKEKEFLIELFTSYYEQQVYKLAATDSCAASKEDMRIRSIAEKLGINGMYPKHIQERF